MCLFKGNVELILPAGVQISRKIVSVTPPLLTRKPSSWKGVFKSLPSEFQRISTLTVQGSLDLEQAYIYNNIASNPQDELMGEHEHNFQSIYKHDYSFLFLIFCHTYLPSNKGFFFFFPQKRIKLYIFDDLQARQVMDKCRVTFYLLFFFILILETFIISRPFSYIQRHIWRHLQVEVGNTDCCLWSQWNTRFWGTFVHKMIQAI